MAENIATPSSIIKKQAGFAGVLRHPGFIVLWLSEALSLIGDRLIMVALVTLVYDRTQSAGAVGLLMVLKSIPALALGSVAGACVDRWNRKWVMVASNLLQGLIVLLIPIVPGIAFVFVAYLIMSTVSQFFVPARASTIPDLVSPEALVAANSLFAIAFVGAIAIGPAIGTWITESYGLSAAFYVDASTFLAPAIAVGLLTIPHQQRQVVDHSLGADLREGFRFVRSQPVVFAALILSTAAFLIIGTLSVTGVVIVSDILGIETSKFGILMSAMGGGMVVGAIAANGLSRHFERIRLAAVGAGLMAIGIAALPWSPNLPLALVFGVTIGLGMTLVQVNAQTILQTASENLRGRLMGISQALMGCATLLASALSGILVERAGPVVVLGGIGLLALMATAAAVTVSRKGR
ncbi:MAG: MFS transporter [Anaerolineae bacterium]|nr:MFS transporter [Anaerolineae bacterium]